MTTSTTMAEHPIVAPPRDRSRDRALVRRWLYVIAGLIVAMVVVGGATRLTDSGLSITEWQPIHGTIPPLSEAEWQEEFAKYRKIPEYEVVNNGMTLTEFKRIFWWEWGHRFLGRLIGAAFLLPLIFFWATGRIDRGLRPKLLGIFVLGGLQGTVGWWMVASGLTERTDVSQYRLAVHLTLACAILAYVLWVARGLADIRVRAAPSLRWAGAAVLGLVFLQIFLGGLVAGLDAGQAYNTWPLMDGSLIPSGLFVQTPAWRNVFENAFTVQFDHRVVAYLLVAAVALHAAQAKGTAYARPAAVLALLVAAQAVLGVATLIAAAPLSLALLHQLGAVAVLGFAAVHLRAMSGPAPAAAQSATA